MMAYIIRLQKNIEGQGMVEYGLIIFLVVASALGAVELFGDGVVGLFERIKTTVIGSIN